MFKQLANAYNNFIQGIYRPDVIAMNPAEWDWYKKGIYIPYEDEHNTEEIKNRIKETRELIKVIPEFTSYKGTGLFFREDVPIGFVDMWRLEPHIMYRRYDLDDGESIVRLDYRLSSILEVSTGKRLQEI